MTTTAKEHLAPAGSLVGEYYQDIDAQGMVASSGYRTAQVFGCGDCGAAVLDPDLHEQWHVQLSGSTNKEEKE